MTKEEQKIMEEVFNTLDGVVGDTDPHLEGDMTEDDIKHEYPVFWCCQQLSQFVGEKARNKAIENG